MTKLRASLLLIPATALLLAGCSPAAGDDEPTGLQVVASTNVYGDIAAAIGGDHVLVTSIISSAAQDPHSYEASARDQLAISKADVVIENGGGYDPFIDTLVSAGASDDVELVNVLNLSGLVPTEDHSAEEHATDDHDHVEGDEYAGEESHDHDHDHAEDDGHEHSAGVNEHVWYDLATASTLASTLAHTFSQLDEANASTYLKNYTAFSAEIDALVERTAELQAMNNGAAVVLTEPVPLYLLDAAGLRNVTPIGFTEAIEEGTDVPPASLQATLDLFGSEEIALLAYNEQTSSPETEQVRDAATAQSIPVVSFAETLPDGEDYVTWMTSNIDALTAVASS